VVVCKTSSDFAEVLITVLALFTFDESRKLAFEEFGIDFTESSKADFTFFRKHTRLLFYVTLGN